MDLVVIWKFILFFLVMPFNGVIISRGGWWILIGLVLMLLQLPWFLINIL